MTAPLYVRLSAGPTIFGLSESTLRRRAAEGHFRLYKVSGATVLKVAEVAAWIEAQAELGGPSGGLARAS